ncbi:hypothetical protein [Catellatospora tritici]|uniref:hypothetical protein n=1 Tax=Catellatospora tritici TaxID=2851566 RepID=UPI001C2D593E|nr:hypothetical protein [Catellatospora tritici]MBV1856178.1 hypothetical protein [Catellatospora tritici]
MVDLDAAELKVIRKSPLGGSYEDCDVAYGWILCTDGFNGQPPLAARLPHLGA